ncbi:P-loop ATPase, Sll1717 family [Pseudomonas sp. RHF3.3-3]|uniref:P-loop ATPase, Sll1717 family n=1 Tax=Pseudomonas sp. RHF3.3-3 TaxID=3396624 RepID=UPI003A8C17FE
MNKKNLLSSIRVGHRVAEDEKNELANYFIKTSQWNKLSNGEIDVIYGAKGTGKSALYSLLTNNIEEFKTRGILLAPAENPLGASAFQELIDDESCSEADLTYIWKLYILQLISAKLRGSNSASSVSTKLIEALETAGLLPKSYTLGSLFSRAINYIKSFGDKETTDIEWTLSLDPTSGAPSATRKASYGPTDIKSKLSSVPVNDLLHFANEGLVDEHLNIWLLFDRLDVSFSSSPELEKSALRALFRVYADLKPYTNIKAKIFVRKDIWERITEGGFREASHVIKTDTIEWDRDGLLNLVISRLLNNQSLVDYLKTDKDTVINDITKQEAIIKRILPEKVDTGKNPDAFDWIVSRVQDGTKKSAPREIIHMLECLLASQLKKIEQGKPEPEAEILFDRTVFKESLSSVSEVRYRQTLCAEYPNLKSYTELLKNEKAEQKIDTLARIWDIPPEKALSIADQLVAAGFFEARNDKNQPTYWVPFLYRDALDLIQGKAN